MNKTRERTVMLLTQSATEHSRLYHIYSGTGWPEGMQLGTEAKHSSVGGVQEGRASGLLSRNTGTLR